MTTKKAAGALKYLHNNLGAKKMAFIMSILVLPDLIECDYG